MSERDRLLHSSGREVFLTWLRELADGQEQLWTEDGTAAEETEISTADRPGDSEGGSLGVNLFIEALLVFIDQARTTVYITSIIVLINGFLFASN